MLAGPLLVKAGRKTDGKKTLSGALLTLGGIGLCLVDQTRDLGLNALVAGVPLMAAGIVHKFFKHKKTGGGNV